MAEQYDTRVSNMPVIHPSTCLRAALQSGAFCDQGSQNLGRCFIYVRVGGEYKPCRAQIALPGMLFSHSMV